MIEQVHNQMAFDFLQAEREAPWLADAFVAPAAFAAMSSGRSIVVFGPSGSGKSALRLRLGAAAREAGHLTVEWQPALPQAPLSGSLAMRHWFTQLLESAMEQLLAQIGRDPAPLAAAPPWVRATVQWFIHHYLVAMAGAPELLVSRLAEKATPDGAALIEQLVGSEPVGLFRDGTPEPKLVGALAESLMRLGYDGIWMLVDGLERLVEQDAAQAAEALKAILSTLGLFEDSRFSVKLFAPPELEGPIMASGGVARRRLDTHSLRWTPEQLLQIVGRRISLLIGKPAFQIEELYPAAEVQAWLGRYGGLVPRGWLEMARPMAVAYLAQGARQPFTTEAWEQLWNTRPPPLRVDIAGNRVFLGYSEILDIPPGAQKLLSYLYRHRGRVCSRGELYYRAFLGHEREPGLDDAAYSAPAEWEGLLNTNLYRLRQAIELDPSRPIYVVSRRGKGVLLDHAT